MCFATTSRVFFLLLSNCLLRKQVLYILLLQNMGNCKVEDRDREINEEK